MPRRIPAAALLAVPLLLFGWQPGHLAQPQSIVLDGQLDAAGYTLLAQDPSNDTAAVFASAPATAWTDLTALYVATDTTNLYLFAALPAYSQDTSTGEIGLAIDTTGDVPTSGGSNDPWGNAISYSYTSILNNISTTARSTLNTILPDIVIRGRLDNTPPNGGDINNGLTELRIWDGSNWSGAGVNWGGLNVPPADHIAYLPGSGVELAIPFSDLGITSTATVNLQFYVTRHTVVEGVYGAIDTVPSDAQSATEHAATIQRRLATWPEPAASPPGPCDSAVVDDGAVVVAGLAHLDTDPAYRNPPGILVAGQSVTLTLRTCAADIASASVLVWNPGDALGTPAHTYALTATAALPDYSRWQVVVPPPAAAVDRQYEFRLTDNGATSYFHPAQGETGPGQWSSTLQAARWRLAMVLVPPPQWRLYLPNVFR